MTFKLLFRNIKKDYRDYGIFIITMMICSAAYYAFFSITSDWYNPSVSVVFDISKIELPMRYAMVGISLISIFLVKHVVSYLLLKKQKEIGLQNLMGINKKSLAKLFFREIVILGIIATVIGILLGGVLAQFVNFFLLKTFNGEGGLIFPYYPDTILYTLFFFTIIFILVGAFESKKISKKRIIELLYAEESEQIKVDGKTIKLIHGLAFLVNIFFLYMGLSLLKNYYDTRVPFIGRIVYFLMALFPAIYVFTMIISKIRKRSESELSKKLVIIESIMAGLNIVYIFVVIQLNLPGESAGIFNYLFRAGAYTAFLIYHYFYIYRYKAKDKSWQSIFFKGQIKSKLNRHGDVFSLISLVIFISVLLLIIQPILSSWSEGYLHSRMVQDIQIISTYNSTTSEDEIVQDDYSEVFQYLEDEGIEVSDYTYVNTYLPKAEDFTKRVRYDFPVTVIKLSEYNHLLKMAGESPVEFSKDEYIVQTQYGSDTSKMDENTFRDLETDRGLYSLSENGIYTKKISEYLYNSHVDALYVLNDSEVEDLTFVGRSLMLDLSEDFNIINARELEDLFDEKYEDSTAYKRFMRIGTIEINSITTVVFIMKTAMNYLSIILLLISFTIIALIELEDSLYNKSRYTTLWQLGISKTQIYSLTSKQLLISFWKPLILGISGAIVIGLLFMMSISNIIVTYIGYGIFGSIGLALLIVTILFVVYYLLTYYMFLSNLKRRD